MAELLLPLDPTPLSRAFVRSRLAGWRKQEWAGVPLYQGGGGGHLRTFAWQQREATQQGAGEFPTSASQSNVKACRSPQLSGGFAGCRGRTPSGVRLLGLVSGFATCSCVVLDVSELQASLHICRMGIRASLWKVWGFEETKYVTCLSGVPHVLAAPEVILVVVVMMMRMMMIGPEKNLGPREGKRVFAFRSCLFFIELEMALFLPGTA